MMPINVFWETGTLPTNVWLPDQGSATYRGRGGQVHVATYNQPPVPDRSPGDFHSTGAPYVPRNDSRGTKPARATS
jgi:hypothetical protein